MESSVVSGIKITVYTGIMYSTMVSGIKITEIN